MTCAVVASDERSRGRRWVNWEMKNSVIVECLDSHIRCHPEACCWSGFIFAEARR